jgi:pimeloyl-ACP methyl ester carboxylesterase
MFFMPSMPSITSSTVSLSIPQKTWYWKGFPVCYQSIGENGPAIVFVHGFGACWGHWRKNLSVLAEDYRCYALDLIGFGDSAKPTPKQEIDYTFSTWGQQVADFCREVVGEPVYLVGNSIGCIVAMQAAVDYPEIALGIALINCSLRLLHEQKRASLPWYRNLGASIVQKLLENAWIGNLFFKQIAQEKVVKKILLQAYCNQEAVTDELIAMIMKPAHQPGAAAVFLAFTAYSHGPLPEDLLPILPCPAIILWGEKDPWEPITLGQQFAQFSTVEKFIPLKNCGHCPQDEAPELVNPILQEWLTNHQQSLLQTEPKN